MILWIFPNFLVSKKTSRKAKSPGTKGTRKSARGKKKKHTSEDEENIDDLFVGKEETSGVERGKYEKGVEEEGMQIWI